jgi:hypothetical protein
MAKTAKVKPPVKTQECIQWLAENDRLLWGQRSLLKEAWIRFCTAVTDSNIKRAMFSKLVKANCVFFKSEEHKARSDSKNGCLSASQWERLHTFLRTQRDLLANDYPMIFFVRWTRMHGYPASESIFMNCSVFKTLTGGRYHK